MEISWKNLVYNYLQYTKSWCWTPQFFNEVLLYNIIILLNTDMLSYSPLFIQTFRRNFVGILHRKVSPFADCTSCRLFPRPPTTCYKFIHFLVTHTEVSAMTHLHNLLFIVGDHQILEYFTGYMFLLCSLGHNRRFSLHNRSRSTAMHLQRSSFHT